MLLYYWVLVTRGGFLPWIEELTEPVFILDPVAGLGTPDFLFCEI